MDRIVRFGDYELNRRTGELRKHGLPVRLQGKPSQVLMKLIDHPGEMVTREELRQCLWPQDTFVDFQSGLNTAVNRLRVTLCDTPDNPRYVETLARSGYRFVASVREVTQETRPSESPAAEEPPAVEPPRPARAGMLRRYWILVAAGCSVAVAGAAGLYYLREPAPAPRVQQLTFRRGSVSNARFAPGGQSVVYSAQWDREPFRLYTANLFSPETRVIGFETEVLGAVSRSGELAMLSSGNVPIGIGANLSRAPVDGGAPLAVAKRVSWAEWDADGKQLLIIRAAGDRNALEIPIDHVVYTTAGTLSHPRVSPDGKRYAFLDHPSRGDDAGNVVVIESDGRSRAISSGWGSIGGLAWAPTGREVWFTAARTGAVKSLWAVSLDGKARPVAAMPGAMMLLDISPEGRVLMSGGMRRTHMLGMLNGDSAEHDLSLFDWSAVEDISPDGNLLLFDESGEGGGANWAVYLRNAQAGTTIRLAEGRAGAVAPHGLWVAVIDPRGIPEITLVPVGEGTPRKVSTGGIRPSWVRYFPDARRLLLTGNEKGKGMGLFVLPLDGGPVTPLPEYLRNAVISPDGARIAGADVDGKIRIISAGGRQLSTISEATGLLPVVWCADGRSILVHHFDRSAVIRISRMDVETGELTPWRELAPSDTVGFRNILRLHASANEKAYAYAFLRSLSELYVIDGWK